MRHSVVALCTLLLACASDAKPEVREKSQPLTVSTSHVCSVVGLGSRLGDGPAGNVAHLPRNFPGVASNWVLWTALGAYPPYAPSPPYFLPSLVQPTVCQAQGCFRDTKAGAYHPAGLSPVVFGTDWPQTFEYRPKTGPVRTVIMFGDTDPGPWIGRDPLNAFVSNNDDLMGYVTQTTSPNSPSGRCVDINFYTRPDDATQLDPVTLDGPYASGGNWGGPLGVPGPGFAVFNATKGYDEAFAIFQDTKAGLTATSGVLPCNTDSECQTFGNGEPGDRCVNDPRIPGKICKYGPGTAQTPVCDVGDQAPCFSRHDRGRLGYSGEGTPAFVTAPVGSKVANSNVEKAYTGRFAVRTFVRNPADTGEVYVFGRENWWGHASYKMHPYLMKQKFLPASGGLQAPLYFKGTCGGAACTDSSTNPDFVTNRAQAARVYDEDKLVVWTTSVKYVPALASKDGKGWVMTYGGRIPPSTLTAHYFVVMGPTAKVSVDVPLPDNYGWDGGGVELGVFMRRAANPWGPWSAATRIYSPTNPQTFGSGYCSIMHWDESPHITPPPSFASQAFAGCAALGLSAQNVSLDRYQRGTGGEYAAEILERFSESTANGAAIYWLLSLWNPYQVVLRRTLINVP